MRILSNFRILKNKEIHLIICFTDSYVFGIEMVKIRM